MGFGKDKAIQSMWKSIACHKFTQMLGVITIIPWQE